MAVAYLTEDEDIGAEHKTALFSAFEHKVTELLGGKSPFLLRNATPLNTPTGQDQVRHLLGSIYYFVNGDVLPYSEAWGAENYDHNKFYTWRNAGTEELEGALARNETNKTTGFTPAEPSPVDLGIYGQGATPGDRCLEALKLGDYYLSEYDQGRGCVGYQQKKYRYAVAEMVYEGRNFEDVLIPKKWDKFNFFRFHNLNPYTMRVRFEGNPENSELEIGPYECRSIRRDSVDSGYDSSGYRYFWKFHSQDPRFYAIPRVPDWSVFASHFANPITNPCILYYWVSQFEGATQEVSNGGVCWYRDKHAVYDIYDIYKDYFGNPNEDATLIGDLLHHKGKLRVFYTDDDGNALHKDAEFKGYASIAADLAQASMTVNDDGNTLAVNTDLLNGGKALDIHGIGSNLLFGSTITNRGFELVTNKPAGDYLVMPLTQGSATASYSYNEMTESGAAVRLAELPFTALDYVREANDNALPIWKTTAAQVKTLNHFGSDDYKFSSQDSVFGSFVSRKLVMTITGLKLQFTQQFTFNSAFREQWGGQLITSQVQRMDNCNVLGASPLEATLGANATVSIKREIALNGYGWPASGSPCPAFLSPRRARAYSEPHFSQDSGLFDYKHPNLTGIPVAPNGADFDETWNGCSYEELGDARALVPVAQELQPFSLWPTWQNPDDVFATLKGGLAETFAHMMPRVYLFRELYNDMAAVVNSITGCFPLDYRFLLVNLGDGTVGRLTPNTVGITGSTLRPLKQFASFGDGSQMHRVCEKLGIPILSENSFPQSYHDFLATGGKGTIWTARARAYSHNVLVPDPLLPKSQWNVLYVARDMVEVSAQSHDGEAYSFYSLQTGAVFGQEPYRWVQIEDVRAAVERYGFKFLYRELSIPWKLEHIDVTPSGGGSVGAIPPPSETSGDEFYTDSDVSIFGGDIWALVPASSDAEWKTYQESPVLADYTPGDVAGAWVPTGDLTNPDTGLLEPASPSALRVESNLPDRLAAEFPSCRQQQIAYRRAVVFQRYCSQTSTLRNGTQILLNSVPWLGHPSDNFSAQSPESGQFAIDYGLALEVKSEMGQSNERPTNDEGETYFTPEPGEAHEIAVFLADQVPLT